MKNIKLKERIENVVEAFFNDTKLTRSENFSFTKNPVGSQTDADESFFVKNKKIVNLLRQVFLFFPGAVGSFFMTVAFTGFFILRPPIGEHNHLYLGVSITLAAFLMTFLGLGNLRNPKHLIISVSIMAIAVILGIIGSFTHGVDNFPSFIDNYVGYFLPSALIAPVLAKDWVNRMEAE